MTTSVLLQIWWMPTQKLCKLDRLLMESCSQENGLIAAFALLLTRQRFLTRSLAVNRGKTDGWLLLVFLFRLPYLIVRNSKQIRKLCRVFIGWSLMVNISFAWWFPAKAWTVTCFAKIPNTHYRISMLIMPTTSSAVLLGPFRQLARWGGVVVVAPTCPNLICA